MRVAHFVQRYPPALGGSEAYFARLSRHLAAQGDEVTVFTTNAIDLENFYTRRGRRIPAGRQREDGVEVRRYPLLHLPFQRYLLKALSFVPHRGLRAVALPWNPLSWAMWRDACRGEEHFDLVHATAFPYSGPLLCARRLADRLGVPFVLTSFVHLGDLDDPADRTRRAYLAPHFVDLAQRADRVFVQTEGERRALVERGVAADRLILQGMGVDLASCTGGNRSQARANWQCEANEVVVGHLANLSREKGTIDLLEAANRAWEKGAAFTVVLAGADMPNFRAFWNEFRPLGKVRQLGVLTDQDKRDFFAGIDVFVLPSRSDSFGIVLLEAWANGVPNLVYRAGGPPWLVRHESDGMVTPCSVDALAEAIARLTSDAELRARLGAAGQARIGEFRWEDKLDLVCRVYRELIKEVPARGASKG